MDHKQLSFFQKITLFLSLLVGNFSKHNGTQNAAALTYTTLLSLVPMMTVFIAVFSAFPVADKVNVLIQDFVFQNFVPTSGEVLQEYLGTFASKASKLSGIGFVFLLLVAIMMMNTINKALNAIWEATSKRKLISQFLIYWAILSLGPVLIGVSVVATSYVVSIPLLQDAYAVEIKEGLIGLMPIIASSLAFGLIYLVVPNRRVSFKHAISGGLFAAILFEIAKRAFAFYITNFPTYEAIYGALATIPIFLIWVYVSWMIVLFGAEFTYSLGIYKHHIKRDVNNQNNLVDAVQLLLFLGKAQIKGESANLKELLSIDESWSELQLEKLLNQMQKQKIIFGSDDDGWVLSRSLNDLSLYSLYRMGEYRLPTENEVEAGPMSEIFKEGHGALEQILNMSVAELNGNHHNDNQNSVEQREEKNESND